MVFGCETTCTISSFHKVGHALRLLPLRHLEHTSRWHSLAAQTQVHRPTEKGSCSRAYFSVVGVPPAGTLLSEDGLTRAPTSASLPGCLSWTKVVVVDLSQRKSRHAKLPRMEQTRRVNRVSLIFGDDQIHFSFGGKLVVSRTFAIPNKKKQQKSLNLVRPSAPGVSSGIATRVFVRPETTSYASPLCASVS